MLQRALLAVVATMLIASIGFSENTDEKTPALTDSLGDPLPDGAIARMGTLRFKHTPAQNSTIDNAVYSPDGTKIASLAHQTGSVRLWDAANGKEILGPWASFGRNYSAVAFTPDSTQLVLALNPRFRPPNMSRDKTIQDIVTLYRIPKGGGASPSDVVKTLKGPIQLVSTIAFCEEGKTLVAAGDGIVRWWDLDSEKEKRSWEPFADEQKNKTESKVFTRKTFTVCTLAPNASAIALQVELRQEDNLGRVIRRGGPENVNQDIETIGYELPSGKKTWQSTVKSSRFPKSRFAYSADGKRLATLVGSEKVELRNSVNGKLLKNPIDLSALFKGRVGGVALSADGRTLAVASSDSEISFFDTDTSAEPRKLKVRGAHHGPEATACLRFAPSDKNIVVAVDSDLQVYDTETLREVGGGAGHRGWVDQLAFIPDGSRLFTGLSGRGPTNPEYFGPNGEVYYLINGTRRGLPLIEQATWDVSTWKRTQFTSARTPPHPHFGNTSLQQTVFAGKTGQDTFCLFDAPSGKLLARMLIPDKQPKEGVGFFSPGGNFYVHYSTANRMDAGERIYVVPSGKLVCVFETVNGNPNRAGYLSTTPGDPSNDIAFSPDEGLVAQYGRGDGLIRVYDTITGKLRRTLGKKMEIDPN